MDLLRCLLAGCSSLLGRLCSCDLFVVLLSLARAALLVLHSLGSWLGRAVLRCADSGTAGTPMSNVSARERREATGYGFFKGALSRSRVENGERALKRIEIRMCSFYRGGVRRARG